MVDANHQKGKVAKALCGRGGPKRAISWSKSSFLTGYPCLKCLQRYEKRYVPTLELMEALT